MQERWWGRGLVCLKMIAVALEYIALLLQSWVSNNVLFDVTLNSPIV